MAEKSQNDSQSGIRIVFMGTPEFAVASLDALVKAGKNIVGVVTAPDKPSGRGLKLNESAVKKYAVQHGLAVLQPQKLKDPAFLEQLKFLNADLQIVVAFRMLPELVWNLPRIGTINLHGSLLPQYRGAAPINRAIMNGEKETGVTTFKLKHEIDTGDVLLREIIPIGEDETAGELHDRMKKIGAKLLVKTVDGLVSGSLIEIPQLVNQEGENAPVLHHAPKIFTNDTEINWNKPVDEIYNQIRGLSPIPGAFTYLQGRVLKIFRAKKENYTPNIPPGAHGTDKKTYLKFAAIDGYIHVLDVQLEGKKRMGVEDFLRGYR